MKKFVARILLWICGSLDGARKELAHAAGMYTQEEAEWPDGGEND